MQIKAIDHLVIPVSDIKKALHFYVDILNMKLDTGSNRYAVTFGTQKINLHVGLAEFSPAAQKPAFGSTDLCFLVEGDLQDIKEEIESKGIHIEEGIIERQGAQGPMESIYLRDPDGNLIELSTLI